MGKTKEIIKVHLHKEYNGKTDYYVSNLTMLYVVLSSKVLGICRQALINYKFYEKRFYANSFCVMEVVTLD